MNRIQERLTPQEYEMFLERFNARSGGTIEQYLEASISVSFNAIITGAFIFPVHEHDMWHEIALREGPPTPPDISNYSTVQLLEEVLRRLKQ